MSRRSSYRSGCGGRKAVRVHARRNTEVVHRPFFTRPRTQSSATLRNCFTFPRVVVRPRGNMNWFVQDKIAGTIEFVIAACVGYTLTIIVAWLRTRRADDSRTRFLRFVRDNGWDSSMLALIAIPSAAFAGLIYGGLL